MKGFCKMWIHGTESVKKDKGEPHKRANDLELKGSLGQSSYQEKIVATTPIGRSVTKMVEKDKKLLRTRFNTAYYLCTKEGPYRDYTDLALEEKNGMKVTKGYKSDRAAFIFVDVIGQPMKDSFVEDLLSANHYSLLTDGSTDASILQQEVIYVLFLSKKGEPVVKFFSIQTTDHAHTEGLKKCIENAFHSIRIVSMYQRFANLNVDGASVNTRVHGGLGVKMKESAPWIIVIHCFNHSLELAVKDTFYKTFFKEVDNMLLKLFYLYRKSPKRLRELKMFSEMYDHSIPKPYKWYGTKWIAHKVKAMEIVLNNHGVYIKHLESLAHTDSQALKPTEIVGKAKKWKKTKFPIHLAIDLDVLTSLKVLSLGFQKEIHDSVSSH